MLLGLNLLLCLCALVIKLGFRQILCVHVVMCPPRPVRDGGVGDVIDVRLTGLRCDMLVLSSSLLRLIYQLSSSL